MDQVLTSTGALLVALALFGVLGCHSVFTSAVVMIMHREVVGCALGFPIVTTQPQKSHSSFVPKPPRLDWISICASVAK